MPTGPTEGSRCAPAQGAASKARWAKRCLLVAGAVLVMLWLGFEGLSALYPFPTDRLDEFRRQKMTVRVLDRHGRPLRSFEGDDGSRMTWVTLKDVSPYVTRATLAVEDRRFYGHPGVDPLAVARAAATNACRGRIVSGASTLTMQLMRILWPKPRTVRGKLVESFRALQVERLLTKEEILEWYLNTAPYGGNLVGVEAASHAYFRKHVQDLTLGEAALLAGLPQSPSRCRPDRHPDRARARRYRVLERMRTCGDISPQEQERAQGEAIPVGRALADLLAPHWAELVRQRYPGQSVLHTTLDLDVQRISELALADGLRTLASQGVTNAAVVVIGNDAAAVRALVGSADFFSEEHQGQVNGATAARSPGSALKPFTYARAFDRRICLPSTVLADVPCRFQGYDPENYDRSYRGPVSAAEALTASLNVPAVRLLAEVGVPDLYDLLVRLGISTLKKGPEHYGLALTLGAGEVSLLELTGAYATLGRGGIYRPCRALETEPVSPGQQVLSEASCYLVSEILSDTARLGGRPLWKTDRSQIRMAWKTGTSYGHRDAWCVAYTPEHTVGVWLGNFDGRASKALVGAEAAAPVAARILDQLDGGGAPRWFRPPPEVVSRDVCTVSGMPPSPHCTALAQALAICGGPAPATCSVHVSVTMDELTGVELCSGCRRGHAVSTGVRERWPEELAGWFRMNQPDRPLVPRHFAECSRTPVTGTGPGILSPGESQVYMLPAAGNAESGKVVFRASSAGDRLYWFVDGALHAAAPPGGQVFWPLRRGRHTVVCSDDAGRSSAVTFDVR